MFAAAVGGGADSSAVDLEARLQALVLLKELNRDLQVSYLQFPKLSAEGRKCHGKLIGCGSPKLSKLSCIDELAHFGE